MRHSMSETTIYALLDPTDGQIRYVGKTRGTLHARLRTHLNDVRRGRVYIPRQKWMAALLASGRTPSITVLQTVPTERWQDAERGWILSLRSFGCSLLNATGGGDGLTLYAPTEATKKKLSAAALLRYADDAERRKTGAAVKAAHANPETRAKLRAAALRHSTEQMTRFVEGGRKFAQSPEGRRVRSETHNGKITSEETRRKISASKQGHRMSAEFCQKRAEYMRGRTLSSEHKAAILAGRQRYFARRKAQREAVTDAR
jgi:NUMOD3 motif